MGIAKDFFIPLGRDFSSIYGFAVAALLLVFVQYYGRMGFANPFFGMPLKIEGYAPSSLEKIFYALPDYFDLSWALFWAYALYAAQILQTGQLIWQKKRWQAGISGLLVVGVPIAIAHMGECILYLHIVAKWEEPHFTLCHFYRLLGDALFL